VKTKTFFVTIGVVKYKDKILLLKRSANRKFHPNKWQPISGFPKEKESAEDCILREIKEETGLDGKITNSGDIFFTHLNNIEWINKTFLIEVDSPDVRIDKKEHSDYKWIEPEEIENFDCINGMDKDLNAVGVL
jgi:8-oxo-dGTP diphosphatase